MKLTITKQYQEFLKSIGLDFQTLLDVAQLPDGTWKEEMSLSTLDYYRLLLAFDKILTDEQILAMSRLQNIQMFMPPFFAALSSKNGLAAIEHFAKYKKSLAPLSLVWNNLMILSASATAMTIPDLNCRALLFSMSSISFWT